MKPKNPYATADDAELARSAGISVKQLRSDREKEDRQTRDSQTGEVVGVKAANERAKNRQP